MASDKLNGVILGMGNPLLDISADIEPALLDKYGLKMNNAILAEEKHLPLYEEMIHKYAVTYVAGGATQNSIRVAQWMLQHPGATAYFGCVGKDEYAKTLEASASGDGVRVHYMHADVPTGTCACLIHDRERSLVANLSAASKFQIDHLLKPDIEAVWKAAKIFYSAGFFLTTSPPSLMHIAKHACETNKVFCLNLSAPFICEFFNGPVMDAMPYVDFLFANESEAEAFGKKMGFHGDVAEIALKCAALPKENKHRERVVVFTQGSKPTVLVYGGKVHLCHVEPLAPEKIVDTNGAGDAFVGGFLAGLALGNKLEDCAQAGHYAASVILATSGTQLSGKPTFKFPKA